MKSFFSLIKPNYQISSTLAKPSYSSYFLNKRFYVANAVSTDHGIKATYPYPNQITNIGKNRNLIEEAIRDHRVIKDLWGRYQKEANRNERQKIANTIIYEFAVHTATEDIVLYPVLEKYYPNIVKHNHADHHHIKEALHKLFSMKISDHGYDDILAKAIKEFEEHAAREECDHFPKLKEAIGNDKQLIKLGEEFEKIRSKVSTQSHLTTHDKMESAICMAAAPLDKIFNSSPSFNILLI
ncbi:hypothetical protein RIR_jg15720.t1 [Rhizophagus irregularis DAOM 181602=DAOM 197198]|nr:hypothetical protein RIR_jg15720.t1 [Rhizophagus irregularis DAOM 181602=DAOM 197198]